MFSATMDDQSSVKQLPILEMSVDDWIEVHDAPCQRNTAARAKRAKQQHLKTLSPVHRICHMAVLPNGAQYKLDGHTRAFLWASGELERPESVYVHTLQASDLSEVSTLYDAFDSPDAVEKSGDRLYGYLRELGHTMKSRMFKRGGVTFALSIITGRSGKLTRETIQSWFGELVMLDNRNYPFRPDTGTQGRDLIAAEIAACLMTLRKDGPAAFKFWDKYVAGQGQSVDGTRDGLEALRQLRDVRSAAKTLTGEANARNFAGHALSAYEAYKKGRVYTGGTRSTNLRTYL